MPDLDREPKIGARARSAAAAVLTLATMFGAAKSVEAGGGPPYSAGGSYCDGVFYNIIVLRI